MLLHTKGILVMTPSSAMVLTGKQALDFSGGVSADDNFGIGGYDRVMGPNGQAQYFAPSLADACELLLRHYDHTYVAPGERFPRRIDDRGPVRPGRAAVPARSRSPTRDFTTVGDVFSPERNPERKKPFDVRSVMRAVTDQDAEPLERWQRWRGRGELGGVGRPRRRAQRAAARSGVPPAAAARLRARRRPRVVDVGHPVPAGLAQDRTRGERRERQPAAGRAGQPVRVRRVAGVDAALATRVRRRDRPRGHQLPRPDRVRRHLPLPRRRVRRVLQGAQPVHGGRGGRGLLRVGDRRRSRRGDGVRPRGARQASTTTRASVAAKERCRTDRTRGGRAAGPARRGHRAGPLREARRAGRRVRLRAHHRPRPADGVGRPDHHRRPAASLDHRRPRPRHRPGPGTGLSTAPGGRPERLVAGTPIRSRAGEEGLRRGSRVWRRARPT